MSLIAADLLLLQQNYADAIPLLSAALAEEATLYTADPIASKCFVLHRRSLAYHHTSQPDKSLQDAQSALALDPPNYLLPLLHNLTATSLFSLSEFESSALACTAALACTPPAPLAKSLKTLRRKCVAEIEDEENENNTATPPPAPLVTAAVKYTSAPKIPKYRYSQSDSFVTIDILQPGVVEGDVRVVFDVNFVECYLTVNGAELRVFSGVTFDDIVVEKCKVVYKPAECRVKLKKEGRNEWHELFSAKGERKVGEGGQGGEEGEGEKGDGGEGSSPSPAPAVDTTTPRPYTSTKDWNAINNNLKKEEEAEKPEGEEALNALFKTIYGDATDETKKAMVKSFQTSGGTVLSTNWNEVKEKDYEKERQAPNGMQWKNWEGDKLEQKED